MSGSGGKKDKVRELRLEVRNLLESEVRREVDKRIDEFKGMRERSWKHWFSELCFCILTANFTAEGGIRIQKALGPDGFLKLSKEELERKLRELGHRFPRKRAEYIVLARSIAEELKGKILGFENSRKARKWLMRNVKGIGMKEASHFLRNVGFFDVAIIDRHVMRLLRDLGFEIKFLSMKKYLELENFLKGFSESLGLEVGVLDLYLWYLRTGKILK